jgi:hypothetical protein
MRTRTARAVRALLGDAAIEDAVVDLGCTALLYEHVEHLRLRDELQKRSNLLGCVLEKLLSLELRERFFVCAPQRVTLSDDRQEIKRLVYDYVPVSVLLGEMTM